MMIVVNRVSKKIYFIVMTWTKIFVTVLSKCLKKKRQQQNYANMLKQQNVGYYHFHLFILSFDDTALY